MRLRTLGPNFAQVDAGLLTVWYSYQTPIAFLVVGQHDGPVVCVSDLGPTTGKHLDLIDGGDKATRISVRLFMSELSRILAERGMG